MVYHTRFTRWLQRASHPQLTLTEAEPPKGTPDMDTEYAEQLRYGKEKVQWYAGKVSQNKKTAAISQQSGAAESRFSKSSASAMPPVRPVVNREVSLSRLDFQKYVILAPFAAWEARDWPMVKTEAPPF